MKNKYLLIAAALAVPFLCSQVCADLVEVEWLDIRPTTPEEQANDAPDGLVFIAGVTTDADILSVNQVLVDQPAGAQLFRHSLATDDSSPPNPAFVGLFPGLGATSYVTTPGATSLLGPGLPGDGATTTYGDLTNDGAQSGFTFAQLTIPMDGLTAPGQAFNGVVSIASTDNPGTVFDVPFSLPLIPEPSTFAILGIALVGLGAFIRKR